MNIAKLTKYDQDRDCNCGQTCVSGMCEYPDGEYIKIDDMKEFLNSSMQLFNDVRLLLLDVDTPTREQRSDIIHRIAQINT